MNRFAKTTILAVASLAAIAAPLASASADSWGRHRHHGSGDAVAAGVIGLAAGALIGSALSQPQPTYVQPEPIYDAPPAYYPAPRAYYPAPRAYYAPPRQVTYYRQGGFEPWSRSWYNYCSDRYRSFNPNTGTYRGYDGRGHFCTAN